MNSLIASLPIVCLIILLTVFRWSVLKAAVAALLVLAATAAFSFAFSADLVWGSIAKAGLITFDIAIILLGAITFFRVMKSTGILDELQQKLMLLTPDHRLQTIIIAWFFGGFIEGIAGFGTPGLVVAPILISIGFPALTAVVISLIANSAAVIFGAVGTPIRVGFEGFDVSGVAENISLINVFAGLVIPVIILAIVVSASTHNKWKSFKEALPWTLFAGFSFTGPMWFFAQWGQEFGSILGAVTGLILSAASIKMGFLVPKTCWNLNSKKRLEKPVVINNSFPFYLPYLLLIILLVAGKLLLNTIQWNISLPGNINHSWKLFNPGWFFLMSLVILSLLQKRLLLDSFDTIKTGSAKIIISLASIFCITLLVQLMVNIGAIKTLAEIIQPSSTFVAAPFLGAFGNFLTGSATVSNLLMAPLLLTNEPANTSVILALQLGGAAAGNIIALQNIIAIKTAVDVKEKEGAIISKTIVACLIYLFLILLWAFLLL